MSSSSVSFGNHWSFNFINDPKRFGFVCARYAFAAKMACQGGPVLELGCSEGIGSSFLLEHASSFTGVDLDSPAVHTAQRNYPDQRYLFINDDFMGKQYGRFQAVVSLDVIEHILLEYESLYFETIKQNLLPNGICVIGTPNITAAPYASAASNLGHVNLYSQERLVSELRKHFEYVLPFGMNDETIHTGYASMAHYLICIAYGKK